MRLQYVLSERSAQVEDRMPSRSESQSQLMPTCKRLLGKESNRGLQEPSDQEERSQMCPED